MAGSYDYCPTGDEADLPGGTVLTQAALNQPLRQGGSAYDDDLKDYFHRNGAIQEDYSGVGTQQLAFHIGNIPVRAPDYYSFTINPPLPPFLRSNPLQGGTIQVTIDRYGHTYLGVGFNEGRSVITPSLSATAGYLLQSNAPSAGQLKSFITGPSISVGGGYGPAVNVTQGNVGSYNPNDFALEAGVSTPQVGVTGTVTAQTPSRFRNRTFGAGSGEHCPLSDRDTTCRQKNRQRATKGGRDREPVGTHPFRLRGSLSTHIRLAPRLEHSGLH
jgi:hypothetical protein